MPGLDVSPTIRWSSPSAASPTISARRARRNSRCRWKRRSRRAVSTAASSTPACAPNTKTEPIRPGQLHVAIIGAGATGTELAAELHHTAREIIAYGLDRIDPERDLQDRSDRGGRPHPARAARAHFRCDPGLAVKLGVEVRTGARVAEVMADGVRLADGEIIPSDLVVWSAGVKAPAFLADIDGLETNRINQLVVRQTLQTTRDDHIFAIGDCASCPRPGYPQPVPPRAQAAHQMAEFMFKQLDERARRPTARGIRLSRLRLAGVARQVQHGRQPDGRR